MPILNAFQIYHADHEIKQPGAHRDWMDVATNSYRCVPLVMANQLGWEIRVERDVSAWWTGGLHPRSVRVTKGEEAAASHFGYGILTFHMYYLFQTPENVNLLVTGPANHPRKGIYPLEGLVETDWSHMTFTMNWRFTHRWRKVTFRAGEPICRILPYPRGFFEGFKLDKIPYHKIPCDLRDKHLEWGNRRVVWNEELHAKGADQVKKEKGSDLMKDYARCVHQTKIKPDADSTR